MKWIGERISYQDHKKPFTTLIITPERVGWKDALMTAWLLMWTTIGIYIFYELIAIDHQRDEKLTLFIYVSFWTYFEYRVLKAFLWLRFGKENIKIDPEYVWVKKSIGKYGKAKSYLIDNVKNISVRTPSEKSIAHQFEKSYWVVGGERILFDYLGKIIHFGRKLDEKDAKLLAKFLEKRVQKYKSINQKNLQ